MVHKNAEWLHQRYWEDRCSLQEMGQEAMCDPTTVCRWMRNLGIPRRGPHERRHPAKDCFWDKVDVCGNDKCWEWMASKRNGYGLFQFNGRNRQSHRVAWVLTYGEIPEGMYVCHHCDNPGCVNPGHLFLGTAQDNDNDKVSKGRQARGERHGRAKLTESDVLEICRLCMQANLCQREVAKMFGVSQTTINSITRGKNWGHVTGIELR